MTKKNLLAGILMVSATGVLASSGGVLYDCDITQKRNGLDWISDKIAIVVKTDGQVVVSDAVILMFHKTPMTARVSRNTDSKLSIRWTLKNVVSDENQTTPAFDYSAVLSKPSNRIAVYAIPEGYPNRFSGKGKCVPRQP